MTLKKKQNLIRKIKRKYHRETIEAINLAFSVPWPEENEPMPLTNQLIKLFGLSRNK